MPNGNGRAANGRFAPGNQGGPGGDTYAIRCSQLRQALIEAVSVADMKAIAKKLLSLAKRGDLDAIRILFDRLLGRPVSPILLGDGTPQERDANGNPVRIYLPENGRDAAEVVRHFMETDPDYLTYAAERKLSPSAGVQIVQRASLYNNPAHEVQERANDAGDGPPEDITAKIEVRS